MAYPVIKNARISILLHQIHANAFRSLKEDFKSDPCFCKKKECQDKFMFIFCVFVIVISPLYYLCASCLFVCFVAS